MDIRSVSCILRQGTFKTISPLSMLKVYKHVAAPYIQSQRYVLE